MANQRDADKVLLAAYVRKKLKKQFLKISKEETGGDQTALMVKMIVEGLKKRGIKLDEKKIVR